MELAARLERPGGELRGYALFAHCFTCSKDLRAAREISRALADRGFAVLRFDFTGLGESEGDFAGTDFSSNVSDLVAAADFLRAEHEAPSLLVGHSLGGAAAIVAAGRISEVRAVVTIGAPSEAAHLRDTLLRANPELEGKDEAEVELAGRRFRIRGELLDDLERQNVDAAVSALGRPLLVLHSPADEIVGIEHAERLFAAARHPKSLVALDGTDHLLTGENAARWAGEILAVWGGKYASGAGETPPAPGLARGEVVVAGGAVGYAVEARSAGHRWRGDEPLENGGADTGPTPYELLLSALGACKAITLRMYADRKEWPLRGTRIRLRHSRIHAEDCANCETEEGMLDRIETELELVGPLADGQRERLLEIAGRCPVHRALESEIDLPSRLS
ncbi:MAG TPA: alpha/beta fold hydrolase [Gemmatimonadota bacterium]|nr:alpha/beta fold hydrolase [Gemmatimonadota bacterium]